MFHEVATDLFRRFTPGPAFQVLGRASYERDWHVIDVYVTRRRDATSRWPLWRGTCITWTSHVIAVGSDFAAILNSEQSISPATTESPVTVATGRLRNATARIAAGWPGVPTASEILAHEIGHTGQARRWGAWYWPAVGSVTLFREGPRWWNRFENEASATGQFAGIVAGAGISRRT